MATDESWGRNLRTAKRAFEEKHDTRLTHKEIGKRVAKAMGRDKPFGHSAVLNWFENGQEPEGFPVVRALAQVLEVDVGALLGPPTNGIQSTVNHDVPRPERPSWPKGEKQPDPMLRQEAQDRTRKKRGA